MPAEGTRERVEETGACFAHIQVWLGWASRKDYSGRKAGAVGRWQVVKGLHVLLVFLPFLSSGGGGRCWAEACRDRRCSQEEAWRRGGCPAISFPRWKLPFNGTLPSLKSSFVRSSNTWDHLYQPHLPQLLGLVSPGTCCHREGGTCHPSRETGRRPLSGR